MRVKTEDNRTGHSSRFNTASVSEVVVGFDDGDQDSVYMRDLDVLIGNDWVDMGEAFRRKLIVPDNHNERFGEPRDEEARERGWNW